MTCSIPDCTKPVRSRGLCGPHYSRWWTYGDPLFFPKRKRRARKYDPVCSVDGCDFPHHSRGYCRRHYHRWITRDGDVGGPGLLPKTGANSGRWKGGIAVVCNGKYVGEYLPEHPMAMPNGYVLQHRLVMSRHVGRLLDSTDIVHHVNGDGFDNHLDNLELTTRAAHINHHRADLEAAKQRKAMLS